jgi:hypothetical protein
VEFDFAQAKRGISRLDRRKASSKVGVEATGELRLGNGHDDR